MIMKFSKLIHSIFSNRFTLVPCGRKPCHCLFNNLTKENIEYQQCYKSWDNYNKKRIKKCKDDICFFNRY